MRTPLTLPALAIAAFAAMVLPGQGEVTSENHPTLKRALTEYPEANKDANGSLSLEEYQQLQPGWQMARKNKASAPLLLVRPNGEIVISDFEDNSYRQHGWKTEGQAFNHDLSAGTKMMKRRVGPYAGKYFITTVISSEVDTGRLFSPPFQLELDYLRMTLSGGDLPQQICVNLYLDDELVRSATGRNDDYFEEVAFDVREFRDRLARIEVRDDHSGLWGHLNLDRIFLTSELGDARLINSKPLDLAALEGLALTSKARALGALWVENGQLGSDHTPLPDKLLLAINPHKPSTERPPGAVHLIDGEIWHATVGNVTGKELSITGRHFGQRNVPIKRIASMEFIAGSPDDAREPGHLYRTDGEPIPGKIIWVRSKDIAIKCPLGIIPIPRASVQRFVYANPAILPERNRDEVGLMDGTLLFGKTSFAGNQLVIAHEILGELKLDWGTVRYLRRNLPELTWLDTLERVVVESIGPARPPPPPQLLESSSDSHLRAIRIMPHTVLRIPLPTPNTPGTFRAQLAPVPGNSADLKVSLLSGEHLVWSQKLTAKSAPFPLSLHLSGAGDLTLKVEFAGPLSFPCGIDLRDPHVLTMTNPGTDPGPKQQN